jgi:hypothetical protein
VYVCKFFVVSTGDGILLDDSGLELDGPDRFEVEQDLLKAELQKIHDLENKSLDDKSEDTSDVE